MVVGNGMIAQKFKSYQEEDNLIIFASGVSNSKISDLDLLSREQLLLSNCIQANKEKYIVYFSTCSIYDPQEFSSIYVQHKIKMEELIKTNAARYTIFRVSNLVGNTSNKHTIFNFYAHQIKSQSSFQLWKFAHRNLIGLDDFFEITNYILKQKLFQNKIVNIANKISIQVVEIVNEMEVFFNTKAHYNLIDRGGSFEIDTHNIEKIIEHFGVQFEKNYIKYLLKTYYA